MELDNLRARLVNAGLGALADEVVAKTQREVRITATPDDAPAPGRSRFGGAPDLPRGVPWPRRRWTLAESRAWPASTQAELAAEIAAGRMVVEAEHVALALPFVAQLDLAELAPHQDVLPRSGRIWLFADQSTPGEEIGGYATVASACLFAPASTALVRIEPPPVPERLGAATLTFAADLAPPEGSEIELPDAEWGTYAKVLTDFAQPEPRHACLGRAEYGSIANVPPDGWISLLRVDTDDAIGAQWGDAAWITFALPEAALAAGNFGATRAFRWYG